MNFAHFRIRMAPNPSDCRVEMDGVDISARIAAFQIASDVDGAPTRVWLAFPAEDLEIEGTAAEVTEVEELDI